MDPPEVPRVNRRAEEIRARLGEVSVADGLAKALGVEHDGEFVMSAAGELERATRMVQSYHGPDLVRSAVAAGFVSGVLFALAVREERDDEQHGG